MDRDRKFYEKWKLIREKGRVKYIITRGIPLGIIVYLFWTIVTLIFDKHKFDPDLYKSRFYYYGIIYSIYGFVIAGYAWKNKEEKYKSFRKYYEDE